MSMRWKGGFIQTWFNPLSSGAGWTRYSGAWTMQSQMQAVSAGTWPIISPPGLYSWGNNTSGQLGLGNTTNYSSPKQVGALTNWSSVSCGYAHNLSIKTDGTLWSWGYNNFGQLGLGNITNYSSPKQVGA